MSKSQSRSPPTESSSKSTTVKRSTKYDLVNPDELSDEKKNNLIKRGLRQDAQKKATNRKH